MPTYLISYATSWPSRSVWVLKLLSMKPDEHPNKTQHARRVHEYPFLVLHSLPLAPTLLSKTTPGACVGLAR